MKRVTIREIYDFYENNLQKTVKNKNKLFNFELNKSIHIKNIVDVLNGHRLFTHKYNLFLIYEPKPRLIMALNLEDKIVNHYFTTKYLVPKLEKKLDDRNVATRTGKGTDYALKLVKKYIEYYKRNNKDFYILKIDISKFFYAIDHDILKSMLYEDLEYDDYLFACKIIDSTNYDYINDKIIDIKNKHNNINLPLYEYGKGLPIGNLSSQCLSVYYLNRLDRYIVHNLKLKHYIRYMDDFLIFSDDKDYLSKCKDIIINKLLNEYKLNINSKKTFIINIKNGFTFLGYKFIIKNNKTLMLIKNSSIVNVKKKIKRKNKMFSNDKLLLNKYFNMLSNYYYSNRVNYKKMSRVVDNLLIIKK